MMFVPSCVGNNFLKLYKNCIRKRQNILSVRNTHSSTNHKLKTSNGQIKPALKDNCCGFRCHPKKKKKNSFKNPEISLAIKPGKPKVNVNGHVT